MHCSTSSHWHHHDDQHQVQTQVSRRDEAAHLVRTLWANCHVHGFDTRRRRTIYSVTKSVPGVGPCPHPRSRHAHHHQFLCVSFDESEHVAVFMVTGLKIAPSRPSSPSRARSVVTISNSLRRHLSRARSVINGLKLALSPPLSNSPQKSSMEKEIERIHKKIVRR
ncbi:hypothetical protein DY000_02001440 [Brassica cretica]|uniref:Uncharacterized protein n=1 Tax=Brassica cretica TaxID=69181 RepID=A0ABQ7CD10_BRACR|nr:hypothetical protein DY000_02001440 [Brassica cretica]